MGNYQSNEIKHDKFSSGDAICSICISNTVLSRLEPCKHLFCDNCLNEYIEECILNRATEVTCPEFKCNFLLNIASIMKYVKSNALFKIYYNKLVQNIILRDENFKQCPTTNCSHIAVKHNLKLQKLNTNTRQSFHVFAIKLGALIVKMKNTGLPAVSYLKDINNSLKKTWE